MVQRDWEAVGDELVGHYRQLLGGVGQPADVGESPVTPRLGGYGHGMPLLRVASPPEHTGRVVQLLAGEAGSTEVSVLAGAVQPDGDDLILAQVPRAQVDPLLARVRAADVPSGIQVAVQPSVRVLPPPPPSPDDEAVVWAQVTAEIQAAGRLCWSNTLLVVAAAMIAAIGILEDQLLLIVGAMALSPDYFPVVDTCLALSRRAWSAARRGAATLVISFAAAAAGAWLLTEALVAIGLVARAGERTTDFTSFIAHPDSLSMVVALIAGVAGALAVTLPDARGLVGVFVSITTIPAAANIGVGIVARDPAEIAGAAVQLLANVCGLLAAGTATLALRHRGRAPRVLQDLLPARRLQ